MKNYLNRIWINAVKAGLKIIDKEKKNKILKDYVSLLTKYNDKILKENLKDLKIAKQKKLDINLINRLELNDKKIEGIRKSVLEIIKLKDPVNRVVSKWSRPNKLKVKKVTIPIGVIGVIYESRPNVTSDVSSLCFKSGNSVILKGGSEAFNSNKIISNLFRKALKKNKVDVNFVQFIEKKNRKVVDFLLSKMESYIDVIIPRGGKNLVKKVKKYSNIPTIGHLEGLCHTFVDENVNHKMASKIILNAKLRNPGICGATETLLVHRKLSSEKINLIINDLLKNNCEIYADDTIRKISPKKIHKATPKDWSTEYLSLKISVKKVNNVEDAVEHINKYGTSHTEAIISNNKKNTKYFFENVKSSILIHNSSTQFADGAELGFGGEVGISTNKLPPRGPVGLNQLVSYKYEVIGNGQIRS